MLQLRYMDIFNFIISIAGFIILLVDNEIVFRNNPGLKTNIDYVPLRDINNILRFINIGITVPLIIMLIVRQDLAFRISKESKYVKHNETFHKDKKLIVALIEVSIHIIFSIPYSEPNLCYSSSGRIVCNPYSDIVMFVALLRFYLIFKVFYHISQSTNTHSREICDINMV